MSSTEQRNTKALRLMTARQADIHLDRLVLTKSQRESIHQLYQAAKSSGQFIPYFESFYDNVENGQHGQQRARDILVELGLDVDCRDQLETRWSSRWSTTWKVGKELVTERERVLYQCYDHRERQKIAEKSTQYDKRPYKRRALTWKRRVPYDFTECLAHIEVTEDRSSCVILRIAGLASHNEACQESVLKRKPYVPLHSHVYEVALHQLHSGASLSIIHKTNDDYIAKGAYRGYHQWNPKSANIRYHLLQQDHSTLYRKFSRQNGIDISRLPQYNINDWLNPKSHRYEPRLSSAIFHYVPRTETEDRFEICVATEEMIDATWKYANKAQILFDGTFGVCSTKGGAQATHASYNTDVLRTLLRSWRKHLEFKGNAEFIPRVVITDNDTRERTALLDTWPNIHLLLCKFHLRQSWKNHRTKLMGGVKANGKQSDLWKEHVHSRLKALEVDLINSTLHSNAVALVETELSYLQYKLLPSPLCMKAANLGIKHLNYLMKEWLPVVLWASWSQHGRDLASVILEIPVEGVLTTTNHLESFNGLLKRSHLRDWKRSGHRLRIDSFIYLLVLSICSSIYQHLHSQQQYKEWLKTRFQLRAVDKDLTVAEAAEAAPCGWWQEDTRRDSAAAEIIKFQRIIITSHCPTFFIASCASLNADIYDPNHVRYVLYIEAEGFCHCTCTDFQTTHCACKHLRALRLIIDGWVSNRQIPALHYPSTIQEAILITDRRNQLVARGSQAHVTGSININLNTSNTGICPTNAPATLDTIVILESQEYWHSKHATAETDDDNDFEQSIDCLRSDTATSESGSDLDDSLYEKNETEGIIRGNEQNYRAIQIQLRSQLEYESSQLLPRLHGLSRLLNEVSEANTTTFTELREIITMLSKQLGEESVVGARSVGGWNTTVASTSQQYVGSSALQILRAPSPEKRQKRKDSHTFY